MKNEFKEGQLKLKTLKTPTEVLLDEQLLEQVLINLIKNAREAIESIDNGQVSVEAADSASQVTVSISDNGPGITEEAKEKIFMPFYSTKKRGSGIGLSLSKQIMQLHNGDLKVESEIGKGAKFVLGF